MCLHNPSGSKCHARLDSTFSFHPANSRCTLEPPAYTASRLFGL
jgi:hypothetical protein